MPINGDGSQSRDFTYVANVVEANLLAAEAVGISGAVLNIATGRRATVTEFAELIGEALGLPVEKEYFAQRAGDVRDSWADVSEAASLLGYRAQIDLSSGLALAADGLLTRRPSHAG